MTRLHRALVPTSLLLAFGAFAGCSDDERAKPEDCTPVVDGAVTIAGEVSGWDPECLEVEAGSTVAFTAELVDDAPHNLAVSGPGLEGTVSTGSPTRDGPLELEVSFPEAGFYQYVCTVHAAMEGDLFAET